MTSMNNQKAYKSQEIASVCYNQLYQHAKYLLLRAGNHNVPECMIQGGC